MQGDFLKNLGIVPQKIRVNKELVWRRGSNFFRTNVPDTLIVKDVVDFADKIESLLSRFGEYGSVHDEVVIEGSYDFSHTSMRHSSKIPENKRAIAYIGDITVAGVEEVWYFKIERENLYRDTFSPRFPV